MKSFFWNCIAPAIFPRMRLTGMLVGMKEILPVSEPGTLTALDGDGCFAESLEAVRNICDPLLPAGSSWGPLTTPAPSVHCGHSRRPAARSAAW